MSEESTAEVAPTEARRRVVLHPRTASARRVDRVRASGSRVRGYQTDTDEVLDFVRRQRQLGLQVFVPAVVVLMLLLAATATVDVLGTWTVGGIPALWLILGPVSLFAILGLAIFNERRALRLEARWIDDHA